MHKPRGSIGEWALLSAHLPKRAPEAVGVLLRDVARDTLHIKLRDDWSPILSEKDDFDVWEQLAEDLREKACEQGAGRILDWLDSTLSHVLRVSSRHVVQVVHFPTTLKNLYREQVVPG